MPDLIATYTKEYRMTDYGPPDTYEVVWTSGHVEHIQAHQVTWPLDFTFSHHERRDRHVMLHGEIEGRWKLVLSAPVEQIHSVRLVTADEPIPGGAS